METCSRSARRIHVRKGVGSETCYGRADRMERVEVLAVPGKPELAAGLKVRGTSRSSAGVRRVLRVLLRLPRACAAPKLGGVGRSCCNSTQAMKAQ
jgi:hypothetical protein